jgi:D-aminopeptidase
MPTELTRRQILAGAAATAAVAATPAAAAIRMAERAIVVSVEETPLGATITDWMPGVPYVRGEVVRWGSRLYWCHDFLAEQAA